MLNLRANLLLVLVPVLLRAVVAAAVPPYVGLLPVASRRACIGIYLDEITCLLLVADPVSYSEAAAAAAEDLLAARMSLMD